MRELLVCIRDSRNIRGCSRRYRYSILIGEMDVGPFCCESYGVKIAEERTGRAAEVPHVTTSIPQIDSLMELLTRNEVTPCTLRDVIEDWL